MENAQQSILQEKFDASAAWQRWANPRSGKHFGRYLLGVMPPGVALAANCKVGLHNRGKVPGRRNADGTWNGDNLGGRLMVEHKATHAKVAEWAKWGCTVGLQAAYFVAVDIDYEGAQIVAEIKRLAFKHLGPTIARSRTGSTRILLMYRRKGETLITKRRTGKVDVLGAGQYYNVDGPHPKGGFYTWDKRPCSIGVVETIPEIDAAMLDAFEAELRETIELMGWGDATTHKAGGSGPRKVLPDASLSAPSDELAVAALLAIPVDSISTRDELVSIIVAFKASLTDADAHYTDVLDWSMRWEGCEEAYIEKIWNSIRGAEVGWEVLAGTARGHGFHDDAQADFGGAVGNALAVHAEAVAGGPEQDVNAGIPETPYDKMLARFLWVEELGRYNNTENGGFLASKEFNAANVAVAPFGRSGERTAEAEFQNAPNARRVATATTRPGKPLITEETNDRGIPVSAVNLWRPSSLKPNDAATDADVAPYLDLVGKLFGPEGTPEREHFLDWWAFVLQKPGQKIGHAMVIIGGQGVGKDTVLTPLFEAVGVHNVASVDTNTLMGQWTFFLKAQIVYGQELITYGRRDLYNYLKPFISGQKARLAVNEKGLRQYFVPNNQNWVATSNHDNAIALEDDDRRFWVHRVLLEESPSDNYFKALYRWFNSGGVENVSGWLLKRDVSAFNPMARPPITSAKRTMLEQSQPTQVRWLRNLLSDGGEFSGRTVLTAAELTRTATDWNAPKGVEPRHAVAALRGEDFKSAYRVRIGNDTPQLWARGLPGALTADAMRERYLAEIAAAKQGQGAA